MRFEKVTKTQLTHLLRKHGEKTIKVWMCPSKCYPNPKHPFNMARDYELNEDDLIPLDLNGGLNELDRIINGYRYYNCTPETGLRVHFYIEK